MKKYASEHFSNFPLASIHPSIKYCVPQSWVREKEDAEDDSSCVIFKWGPSPMGKIQLRPNMATNSPYTTSKIFFSENRT